MTMYFAKSTNGFYDSNINSNIPNDVVEITFEQWESLLVGQSNGQQITSDVNGNPILIAPLQIPLTAEQQAQEAAKASALSKLAALGLTEDEIKALLG